MDDEHGIEIAGWAVAFHTSHVPGKQEGRGQTSIPDSIQKSTSRVEPPTLSSQDTSASILTASTSKSRKIQRAVTSVKSSVDAQMAPKDIANVGPELKNDDDRWEVPNASEPSAATLHPKLPKTRGDLTSQGKSGGRGGGSRPRIKKDRSSFTINTEMCKYDVVRDCSKRFGLKVVDDSQPWTIFWIDTGVSVPRVLSMEPYQKINHFPGMHEICRKDHLARNMARLGRMLPKEYNFFPKTYILPTDYDELKQFLKSQSARTRKSQTYIAKPDHGCQGKGIFLFKNLKGISSRRNESLIVQKYLTWPYLIDAHKFDMRIYVLVTSTNPLRIFMHRCGLARFATEPYAKPEESNLDHVCMHLTNYAINKKSPGFDRTESDDRGSKRTLASVFRHLTQKYGRKRAEKVWDRITEVLVKTLIIIQPQISAILKACFPRSSSSQVADETTKKAKSPVHSSQCFEILGFDIMLDHKLKPWVLEVNHSPSFTTDSQLDVEVKRRVIGDTLGLLNIAGTANKKLYEKNERNKTHNRLFGSTTTSPTPPPPQQQQQLSFNLAASTPPPYPTTSPEPIHRQPDDDDANDGDDASSATSDDPDEPHYAQTNHKKHPNDDNEPSSSQTVPPPPRPLSPHSQHLVRSFQEAQATPTMTTLQAYEDAHLGAFTRIFPPEQGEEHKLARYLKCLDAASKAVYGEETTTMRARRELLKKRLEAESNAAASIAAASSSNAAGTPAMTAIATATESVERLYDDVKPRFLDWRRKHRLSNMQSHTSLGFTTTDTTITLSSSQTLVGRQRQRPASSTSSSTTTTKVPFSASQIDMLDQWFHGHTKTTKSSVPATLVVQPDSNNNNSHISPTSMHSHSIITPATALRVVVGTHATSFARGSTSTINPMMNMSVGGGTGSMMSVASYRSPFSAPRRDIVQQHGVRSLQSISHYSKQQQQSGSSLSNPQSIRSSVSSNHSKGSGATMQPVMQYYNLSG